MAQTSRFLESIIESSVAGIITIDSDGVIQTFSPAAEHLFGYAPRDVIGHNVSLLMPEPDHSRHDGHVADYLSSGIAHIIGVGRQVTGLRKDGTLLPLHLSVGEFDVDGRHMFVGIVHDISAEVASRSALLEIKGRFRQLVDGAEEVFILRTTEPVRYLYISPAVEKVFGLTADEAIADPAYFLSFTHPDDIEFVRKTMKEAGDTSRVAVEYRIIRSNGEVRWVWTRYQQVEVAPGDPPLVAVVLADITVQKNAQRAEMSARAEAVRANAAKTEFLSRMSHELRTPMNAILGFAQLLELDELSEDQRESVHQIIRGGQHLLDLINEVLDISRIDSGHLALSSEAVLVSDVMDEVVGLVTPLLTARNLTVLTPAGNVYRKHVLADRQRFKQVLLNFVSNAIKYNRNGGEIKLTGGIRPNEEFAITVSDTGIGIGSEEIKRLFTPFDRLGQESSAEEGTGVGLALAQRLTQMMGGRVEVESTLGVGSSFTVLLPLAETDGSLPDEQHVRGVGTANTNATSHSRASQLTVVYIEDNLANVRLMERIAERRQGLTLIHAMQGRLGLDLVSSSQPGLIFLDLHLPDMSGEEVLRRLQAEITTRDIPTVVVSADASPGQIRRVMEMGAAGYLTKPFRIDELMAWFDDPDRTRDEAS